MIRKPKRNNPRGSDEYKSMCLIVKRRDKFKCQIPGCGQKGTQVHHIRRYADNTSGRLNPSNCVLLCTNCHVHKVTGNELAYAALFVRIVGENISSQKKK